MSWTRFNAKPEKRSLLYWGAVRGAHPTIVIVNSEHYESSSEHYESSSEHYEPSSEHYESSSEHYDRLKQIAAPVCNKKRANKEDVKQAIAQLCSEQYLPLRTLAELLGRQPDSIRNHYLNPMLEEGLLELQDPDSPKHPQQAYRTVSQPDDRSS